MIMKESKTGSAPLFLSALTFLTTAMILLFIVCMGNSHLYANNNTYLDITSIVPGSVTYEGDAVTYNYELNVKYGRGGVTNAFFTFSSGNTGNFQSRMLSQGGEMLQYQLYKDSSELNVLKNFDAGDIGSDNVLRLRRINRGTYTVDYVLSLPKNQHVPTGIYMDSITVKGYLGSPDDDDPQEMQTITIDYAVTVPSNVKIAVIPFNAMMDFTSSDFNLDFGQLPGEEQAFDIIVDASVSYSIAVRSTNGGELVNISNGDSSSTAPYIFKLHNQEQISLDSAGDTTIITSNQSSQGAGDRYHASVRVLDFESLDPGMYQDVLTFTILAD